MSKKFLYLLTFFYTLPLNAATYILMPTGQLELPIKVTQNISVKGKANIKVDSTSKYYRVIAKKSGMSFVSDSKTTHTIIVYPVKIYNFASEISDAIKDMRGPRIEYSKEHPIISGRILHISDLLQLSNISLKNSYNFKLKSELEPEVEEALQEIFSNYVEKNNLSQIRFVKNKKSYHVEVTGDKKLSDSQKQYIDSFGIDVIYDKNKIALVPMIELKVHITELRKSGFYKFGLNWPNTYSASILPREITNKLEVELNLMEESGRGSILAEPTLVCKSGEEASFFAGGEIPIPMIGLYTKRIVWKPYGVKLKFNPVANNSGELTIDLSTEITSIDSSRSIDGVPALFKNEVSSKFNLKKPSTIALTGMLKSSDGKALSGIPLLSKIPILGNLFSSSDYRNNKTRLLILVTPKLIKVS